MGTNSLGLITFIVIFVLILKIYISSPKKSDMMEFCKDKIVELNRMLKHANQSVGYIETGKDLRGEERNFEQLTREVECNVNSLKYHIQQLTELQEKKILIDLIENVLANFRKFDVDILDAYSRKYNDNYAKAEQWKTYGNLASKIGETILFYDPQDYLANKVHVTNIPKQMDVSEMKLRGYGYGISYIVKKIFNYQKTKKIKKCNVIKTHINNFNRITSEFRCAFNNLNGIKNELIVSLTEDIKEDEQVYSQDMTNSIDDNINIKKKPGRTKGEWTSGDLSLLDEAGLIQLMLEIYNKTNNYEFKDVSNIDKESYDAIWAAITYYSALRLNYVNKKYKPNSAPYERTIKNLHLNCSRNTVADYYIYVELYFSVSPVESIKEFIDLAKMNQIEELKKQLKALEHTSTSLSIAKLEFFAINYNVLCIMCEQLTELFTKKLELKLYGNK